jgi:hypothetical protein
MVWCGKRGTLSDECCLREVVSIVRRFKWDEVEVKNQSKTKRQCHNAPRLSIFSTVRLCVEVASYHLKTIFQYIITLARLVLQFFFDAVVLAAHEKARMLRRPVLEYHQMTLKTLLYITSRRFPAFKFKEI